MKQCDKKSLLTLCLGAAGMSLRLLQNMTGFEPGTGLPIPGSIPGILLPVLLALFLQTMYGAVDLLVVGKFGTPVDVSAVGTGSQIMTTLTNLLVSFSMGKIGKC